VNWSGIATAGGNLHSHRVLLSDGTIFATLLPLTNSNPLAVATVDASGDPVSPLTDASLVNPFHPQPNVAGIVIGGVDPDNGTLQAALVSSGGALAVNLQPRFQATSDPFVLDAVREVSLTGTGNAGSRYGATQDGPNGHGLVVLSMLVQPQAGFSGIIVFEGNGYEGWESVFAYPPIGTPVTSVSFDDSGDQLVTVQIPAGAYSAVRARISAVSGSATVNWSGIATAGGHLHSHRTLLSDGTVFYTALTDAELRATPVPVAGTVTPGTRQDTFVAAAAGTAINTGAGYKHYGIVVTATGAVTSWDVRLEVSVNGSAFTQVIQHTNVDGSGVNKWNPTTIPAAAGIAFRSNCVGLVLGAGTNIIVDIVGMP
jgi:hypothetical protein